MNIVTSRILVFLGIYVFAMAFLWIVDGLYFNIFDRYEHAKVISIYLGSGFGIALTVFVSFLIMEIIRHKNKLKFLSVPIITSYFLAVLILPFAFMAGVVAGGTLGGGLLESLFSWLHLNTKIGIPIGIGLGVFFISLLVTLPVLFFGYFLGRGINKVKK